MNPRTFAILIKILGKMANKGSKVPKGIKSQPKGRDIDKTLNELFKWSKEGKDAPFKGNWRTPRGSKSDIPSAKDLKGWMGKGPIRQHGSETYGKGKSDLKHNEKDLWSLFNKLNSEKGRRLRSGDVDVPYKKRPMGGAPSKSNPRGLPSKPIEDINTWLAQASAHTRPQLPYLQALTKGTYKKGPKGPPLSTPLTKALVSKAKKGRGREEYDVTTGKRVPAKGMVPLNQSPAQILLELVGGTATKGSLESLSRLAPYENFPTEEEFARMTETEIDEMVEEQIRRYEEGGEREELRAKTLEETFMGEGSPRLNAALISALGGGAGASLGSALSNKGYRASATGGPQPPSR